VDRSGERVPLLSGEAVGRRQFLRGVAATGVAAGAGGLLAACGGSSAKGKAQAAKSIVQKRGGNLSLGMSGGSSFDTIDPNGGVTYLDFTRCNSLYNPLVFYNNNADVEMVLAKSITPRNNNFAEWVIELKPGITFHDGKPLTADDVIFTFNRIVKGGLSGSVALGQIDAKNMKKLDTHTVLVPFKSPFGSFVEQLAAFFVFLYIAPVGFNPKKPVGTGPFVFKSFTAGQRSVFTRNPHYWKPGLPYADQLTVIDFPDNASLQDALITNVIQGAGDLDAPQLAALANTKGVHAVAAKAGAIIPFTMRVDQAPFNDVRVRQALRLLVDRQQLIDSALDGYGVVASDVFSLYDPDFDHSLVRQADIPQAKSLLKQAGHDNLTVQLTSSAIATGTVAMATVLSEQAKAAGVTIKLNTVDSGTFFTTGKYLNWTFSQDYYPYSPYLAQVAYSMLPSSPFNETHHNVPHYNDLYQQANATHSASVSKEIQYEMQKIDFTEGGYIIPAFIDSLDAYSDKITGFSAAKVGEPLSNFDTEHFSFV
jgi:peptide/nickel transport system substrate-binding protein